MFSCFVFMIKSDPTTKSCLSMRGIAMPDLHHPTDLGDPFLGNAAENEGTHEKIMSPPNV